MTIQEAIRQRIERFNRLWVKAVGYSFEDEVEIMEKERDDAVNKANERAKEIGYSDYQEYIEKLNSFYKYTYLFKTKAKLFTLMETGLDSTTSTCQ